MILDFLTTTSKVNQNEILSIFWKEKDYDKVIKLCSSNTDFFSKIYTARAFFYKGNLNKSEKMFSKIGFKFEEFYSRLLTGDKAGANKIIEAVDVVSPALEWGKILINFLDGDYSKMPRFFVIRNFYETTLDDFLTYKLEDFAEKLIEASNYMADKNAEIYKFTGRVLFNHKYYEYAEQFLNAGIQIAYSDPEVHFIKAELFIVQKKYLAAKNSIETIMKVAPDYAPASMLLRKIQNIK